MYVIFEHLETFKSWQNLHIFADPYRQSRAFVFAKFLLDALSIKH